MVSVNAERSQQRVGPSLASLALVFGRDANLTFGGGNATSETLRRELVEQRGWLSNADFRSAYAASRVTPATSLLALCAAVGWQMRGAAGTAVALLASSAPSAVLATIVMAGYQQASRYPTLDHAVRGAVAVAVALLFASVWALIKPHVIERGRLRAVVIVVMSWAANALFGVTPFVILVVAATLGAIWVEEPRP